MDNNVNELQIYKIVTAMSQDVLYRYEIAEDEITYFYGNTDFARFGQGRKRFTEYAETFYRNTADEAAMEKILSIIRFGTPGFFEVELHTNQTNGDRKLSLVTGRVLYDDDNNPAYIVGRVHEIQPRSKNTEPAEDGFHKDALTGAYDRSSFKHKLEAAMEQFEPDDIRGYLLFAVDELRTNCNNMSYLENVVMVNVVQTVKRIFPYNVVIGRVRYDEIGLFYIGKDIENEFLAKVDVLEREVRKIEMEGLQRPITISGGIYFANAKDVNAYDMRDRTRIAQIAASNRGKGRIVMYREELENVYNSDFNLEAEYNDTRFDYDLVEKAMDIMTASGNAEESINELLRKIGLMYNLDRITVRSMDEESYNLPVLARWIDVHSTSAVVEPTLISYDLVRNLHEGAEDSYVDNEHGAVICRFTGTFGDRGIIDFKARENNRVWSEREIRTFKLLTKLTSAYLLNMQSYMKLLEENEEAKSHDGVTGFAKYERFVQEATAYIIENPDKNLAILYTGMKDFLGVNAKYGNTIGDEVLKGYADELLQTEDRVVMGCRRNADNFVALVNCFDLRGNPISSAMVERMSKSFQGKFAEKCAGVDLAINAGVVFLPKEGLGDLHEYIDRALIARDKARADDNTSCILA